MKPVGSALVMLTAALIAACAQAPESAKETSSEVSHAAVTPLGRSTVEDFFEATGSVQARRRVVLAAKVIGNVSSVRVGEGDSVKSGQLLLEIDSRDLVTQVRQAEAGLREAQAALEEVDQAIRAGESGKSAAEASLRLASSTLERFTALRDRNSVSPHEFDEVASRQESARAELDRAQATLEAHRAKRVQVLARLDQAQSQIDASKVALGYARILSPFDGVVTSKLVDTGAQAAPGVPLMAIESRDYEINVVVPESQMVHVRQGTRVGVSVPAVGLDEVSGAVTSIVPAVDSVTRSYIAKLRLSTPVSALRSGMFARTRVPTGKRECVVVPVTAIVERGQLTSVYALDSSNVIRVRLIRTGQRHGDNVEVLSGLTAGDRVFLHPDSTVKDGARWMQ